MPRHVSLSRPLLAPLAFAAACTLSSCTLVSVGTQSQPICSWDNSPPANAGPLCTRTFTALQGLASANVHGQGTEIRRTVTNHRVAARIIQFGHRMRAEGNFTLHVVPSLTLRTIGTNRYAAEFYLMGKTNRTEVKAAQEVLFLRDEGTRVVVTGDQSGPEW